MASSSDNISMAVFCDFENVALGVRDANYDKFDIKPVLERLLLKGSITVKKAYCDWERYKGFKATMHEANFELIEIPHVRQSGKNSADIRLVVDALDLCYTKSHVNTFVIISGDSDFSPLVSKLRENNKQVIGVGVKQSTSDLLVANCDEFIFYDDLVREVRRAAAKRDERKAQPQPQGRRQPTDENNKRKEELEARKTQALDMVAETFDALVSERGDSGKIWASLLKDTLKRRRPDFSETYYGFRTFGNLLEEAQSRGMFEFGRDEKSGAYVFRSTASTAPALEQLNGSTEGELPELLAEAEPEAVAETRPEPRGRGRGGRNRGGRGEAQAAQEPVQEQEQLEPVAAEEAQEVAAPAEQGRRERTPRPKRGYRAELPAQQEEEAEQPAVEAVAEVQPEAEAEAAPRGRGRGRGGRNQRPQPQAVEAGAEMVAPEELQAFQAEPAQEIVVAEEEVAEQPAKKERRRSTRKTAAEKAAEKVAAAEVVEVAAPEADVATLDEDYSDPDDVNGNTWSAEPEATPARKRPARGRRPVKSKG